MRALLEDAIDAASRGDVDRLMAICADRARWSAGVAAQLRSRDMWSAESLAATARFAEAVLRLGPEAAGRAAAFEWVLWVLRVGCECIEEAARRPRGASPSPRLRLCRPGTSPFDAPLPEDVVDHSRAAALVELPTVRAALCAAGLRRPEPWLRASADDRGGRPHCTHAA